MCGNRRRCRYHAKTKMWIINEWMNGSFDWCIRDTCLNREQQFAFIGVINNVSTFQAYIYRHALHQSWVISYWWYIYERNMNNLIDMVTVVDGSLHSRCSARYKTTQRLVFYSWQQTYGIRSNGIAVILQSLRQTYFASVSAFCDTDINKDQLLGKFLNIFTQGITKDFPKATGEWRKGHWLREDSPPTDRPSGHAPDREHWLHSS